MGLAKSNASSLPKLCGLWSSMPWRILQGCNGHGQSARILMLNYVLGPAQSNPPILLVIKLKFRKAKYFVKVIWLVRDRTKTMKRLLFFFCHLWVFLHYDNASKHHVRYVKSLSRVKKFQKKILSPMYWKLSGNREDSVLIFWKNVRKFQAGEACGCTQANKHFLCSLQNWLRSSLRDCELGFRRLSKYRGNTLRFQAAAPLSKSIKPRAI